MGLAPGISLSAEPPTTIRPAAWRQDSGGKLENAPVHSVYATVTLANMGAHSADHVKIELDLAALPAGVECDPTEPALIGTLAPNQAARATFQLRWKGLAGVPPFRCVGDVSYFTAGAPAHLRPSTW